MTEYEPIIVKINTEGKIEITEEEFKEIIKNAYNNGFVTGKNSNEKIYILTPSPTNVPQYIPPAYIGDVPPPNYPNYPIRFNEFYCISKGADVKC